MQDNLSGIDIPVKVAKFLMRLMKSCIHFRKMEAYWRFGLAKEKILFVHMKARQMKVMGSYHSVYEPMGLEKVIQMVSTIFLKETVEKNLQERDSFSKN